MRFGGLLLIAALLTAFAASAVCAADAEVTLKALREISPLSVNDWRFKLGGEPGGEKPDLDDSSWQLVKPEHAWNLENGRAWYRKTIEIPDQIGGCSVAGEQLILRIGIDDDGEIFINGEKKHEFHWQTEYVLAEKAQPGEKIQLAVLARNGPNPGRMLWAQLTTPALKSLESAVSNYISSIETARRFGTVDKTNEKLCQAAVDRSISRVDMKALQSMNLPAFISSIEMARAELNPVAKISRKYGVDLMGHAHIDLAWLWRWPETVDVCRNTFRSVLKLMDEYPDFTFSQSQAQAYWWMEQYDPTLFKQIQRRVKEGRWEITGGMWVEPDCFIPSGESFVRQLLYGKRYFLDRFGVDVKVGWNPDTFGFARTLPQIYRKAGVDSFLTWRVSTDRVFGYPRTFWWEAPDGSRILTTFCDDYNGSISMGLANRPVEHKQQTGMNRINHVYGVGDHGGGPTRAMLEQIETMRKTEWCPDMRYSTAQGYFDYLRSTGINFSTWNDELYNNLNGCLTPQADVKKANRKSEVLLGEAELFGTLASTLYGSKYAPGEYETLWRLVMLNQFHDILSGTGIHAIYKDTLWDFAKAQAGGNRLLNASLDVLVRKIDTTGPGKAVAVFNPLSWERTDVVSVSLPDDKYYYITDFRDQRIPCQKILDNGREFLIFIAERIPPVGFRIYRLVEGNAGNSISHPGGNSTLENNFLRATVDPQSGCISSLYDKVNQREAFSGPANMLQTFKDMDSAWTVNANYDKECQNIEKADSVELIENGPVRAVIRVRKHFQNSVFTQDLTIYDKIPRLDCRMHVSWNDRHVMLKTAFPMAEKSDIAAYDSAYGFIERSTKMETPQERYKVEVAGQKWADISGKDFGVSILNDCKYSWDARGNVLRLTLLRSSTEPDPNADEGEHTFAYSIYPHKGNWRVAGTVRRGYEFNTPLIARITDSHAGPLPQTCSFLNVAPENVIFGALKKAEDSNRWILRVYESTGQNSTAFITLPKAPRRVFETDLMEKNLVEIKVDGAIIRVPIGAHEIKTLAVEY